MNIKFRLFFVAFITMLWIVPGIVFGDQDVEGNIAGEWTAEESPYYVVGTITIPEGKELYIHPGVDVIFNDHYAIEVEGTLIADGGEDDERIFFEGEETAWDGIYFRRRNDYESSIRNCDLINVRAGISCFYNSPLIIGSNIDARNVAVSCISASPMIRENTLNTSDNDVSLEIYSISLRDESRPRIEMNKLFAVAESGGTATGILINESDPLIIDNWIEIESDDGAVNGIKAYLADKLTIKRNIIKLKSDGEIKGLWPTQTSEVNFINNNIIIEGSSQNAIGILIGVGSEITVINNIVIGNIYDGGLSIGLNSQNGALSDSSGYNDFWDHHVNYVGEYQGSGDIQENPLFDEESELPYRLAWPDYPRMEDEDRSPCIGAGSPNLNDNDDSESDIGCFPFEEPNQEKDQQLIVNEFQMLSAYPNPFNSSTKLSYNLTSPNQVKLILYNSMGRQIEIIQSAYLNAGAHAISWNGANYPSGGYLFMLKVGDSFSSQKVVLIR